MLSRRTKLGLCVVALAAAQLLSQPTRASALSCESFQPLCIEGTLCDTNPSNFGQYDSICREYCGPDSQYAVGSCVENPAYCPNGLGIGCWVQ